MRRTEQTAALWHGEETLEPRQYETSFPQGVARYTIKQDDHWDYISFRAYGRHDLYYLILDANKIEDPTTELPIGEQILVPIL